MGLNINLKDKFTFNKKKSRNVFGEEISFRKRRKSSLDEKDKNRTKEIIIWVLCVSASILLAFLTIKYAVEKTSVADESMSKTLEKEDKVLINKFIYNFSSPKRFDVIVFEQSSKEHSFYNIKRIIGLPGEKIKIKDGNVYVDNKILDEKITVDECNNPGLAEEEITLEENEYFVLGDNRNNSEDSRFANIGVIKKNDIIGKAWFRLNSFKTISKLNLAQD